MCEERTVPAPATGRELATVVRVWLDDGRWWARLTGEKRMVLCATAGWDAVREAADHYGVPVESVLVDAEEVQP